MLDIFGGKITTLRLAESAKDKLAAHLPNLPPKWTATVALPGGDFTVDGGPQIVADLQATYPFLATFWANPLIRACGTKARAVLGDATNTARTMLYDIHKGAWGKDICDLYDIPMEILPEVKDRATNFDMTRADLFCHPIPIPGGPRHDETDLWHGVYYAFEDSGYGGGVEKPSADVHRPSAGWQVDPCAEWVELYRGRCGAHGCATG